MKDWNWKLEDSVGLSESVQIFKQLANQKDI